jgi:hypothetical protein
VAADAIVDAAGLAGDDTRAFVADLNGFKQGHGASRGLCVLSNWMLTCG